MSSRQAFLAGAATGSSVTGLMAVLVANRRKIADKLRRRRGPAPLQPAPRSIPRPIPIPGAPGSSSGASRPIPKLIPIPGAPGSSSAASVSMSNPIPIPGAPDSSPATSGPMVKPTPLPLLNTPAEKTHLQAAASIAVSNDDGNDTTTSGYRVLRDDGHDTGLSLTPHLDKNHTPQDGWVVTHSRTGKLVDGPFVTRPDAHNLATQLAAIENWDQERMPISDLKRAATIVDQHRRARKIQGAD